MKKLSILAALGAFALLGAGALYAQTTTIPQVSTVDPVNDRVQNVPQGRPSAQSVYASPAQVNSAKRYQLNPSTDGLHNNSTASYTFNSNSTSRMIFQNSGTMAYAYVTFAANPSDGLEQCVFGKAAITLFYPLANTGQTLDNAATTISANGHVCYLYGLSNATWYRTE